MGIYIVSYAATSLVVYSGARTSILESTTTALNQFADLKYEQLVDATDTLATNLTAWSELEVMNDLVSGDIDKRIAQALDGLKKLYTLPGDIYAFSVDGKLIASTRVAETGARIGRIPALWQNQGTQLVLIGKQTDPMSGSESIALDMPIFASFNRDYRIGTLVMTYPWASVEQQIFSIGNETMLVERGAIPRILAASRASPNSIEIDDSGAAPGFVVGRSILRSGIVGDWQVIIWQESSAVSRPLRRVALELVLLGALLGLPIAVLGRWLSHRLTAPIAELTRAVREIADTDRLDARVPSSSSDELGTLARSFNRMTDNLEKANREREQFVQELAALNQTLEAKIAARTEELENAIKSQQRLIGDISHEIKSPLARLSVALGLARRVDISNTAKQLDRMEKEIENISALATELLTLARLDEAGASRNFEQVELCALVEQVLDDAIYEAPHRESDIILRKPHEPIEITGDPALLQRAVENVVRNAIFYTTEKTPVEIVLARKGPEVISIEVQDRGPGVPTLALAHLFEPFFRVDEARTRETGGTGIGLAICQRAVQLHGGSVCARNNEPHGLIVEIELPSIQTAS